MYYCVSLNIVYSYIILLHEPELQPPSLTQFLVHVCQQTPQITPREIRICKSEAKIFPSLWATKLCHRRKVSFTANLRFFRPTQVCLHCRSTFSKSQVLEIGKLLPSSGETNTYYKHTINRKPFRVDCIGTIVAPSSIKGNESLTTKSPKKSLPYKTTNYHRNCPGPINEQSWKDVSRR